MYVGEITETFVLSRTNLKPAEGRADWPRVLGLTNRGVLSKV